MDHINQLTASINQTTLTNSEQKQQLSTETHSQANQERSVNLVIDLFEDWLRMYGSKLKERQTLDLRTAELWTLAIRNSGITLAEFKTAAELSLNLKWPPTAAQDFIELVRQDKPSEYPSAQAAFDNACNQCGLIEDRYVKRKWLHNVVLETANRIGMGKLKTADNYFLKTFLGVYEQVIAEHKQGANFEVAKDKRLEVGKHQPVQAGSEADKKITEQLAKLRRMAV